MLVGNSRYIGISGLSRNSQIPVLIMTKTPTLLSEDVWVEPCILYLCIKKSSFCRMDVYEISVNLHKLDTASENNTYANFSMSMF